MLNVHDPQINIITHNFAAGENNPHPHPRKKNSIYMIFLTLLAEFISYVLK
jgi:hypothetical protein